MRVIRPRFARSRPRTRAALATAALLAAGTWQSAWGSGATTSPHVLVSQVSVDALVAAGEAWVATNPRHPSQVVVIWLATSDPTDPAALFSGYCGVGRSTDGGRTWHRSTLPLATTTGDPSVDEAQLAGRMLPICGDPMAGVGPDGTLYGAAVQLGVPSWTQGVTSRDFGAHWTAPYPVFGVTRTAAAIGGVVDAKRPAIGMGRGFMAVDPVTGAVSVQSQEDGAVEGRWLTVSADRGKTWTTPQPLDPEVQSATAGPQAAARGIIGVGYVVDPTTPGYLMSPTHAVTCATACTVFETTANDGKTWSRHVIKGIKGGERSYVAADPTHRGRFAVLVADGGGGYDIWLTPDRGATWTKTKTIAPAGDDTLSMPWIAYSPTGALGIVWRVAHAAQTTDVLASVSRDGGRSFSSPVTMAAGIPYVQHVLPGDDCACNLDLDATTLSATWSSTRTGQRQIYFGRFTYRNR